VANEQKHEKSVTQLARRTTTAWRASIYASVVLWVAAIGGNVALFAVHPARHWPLLETVETLQVASLIPVALVLHALNRRSALSLPVTALGIAAMLAGVAIDIGFVTELVTYGKGVIGGPGFYIYEVLVLVWLLAANVLAWRADTLPRGLALLGMATAGTATLLYPLWAIWLLRVLRHK
jgi:hypothetical protein